jgi:hypothetical protein
MAETLSGNSQPGIDLWLISIVRASARQSAICQKEEEESI